MAGKTPLLKGVPMYNTLLRKRLQDVVDEITKLKPRLDTGAYSKAPDVLARKAQRIGDELSDIATRWDFERDIVNV